MEHVAEMTAHTAAPVLLAMVTMTVPGYWDHVTPSPVSMEGPVFLMGGASCVTAISDPKDHSVLNM